MIQRLPFYIYGYTALAIPLKGAVKMIKYTYYKNKKANERLPDIFDDRYVENVRKFHESIPVYSRTPLIKLDHLADELGVGKIYVKDESFRFGLNSFKVLGGSYAIAKCIAERTGLDKEPLLFKDITSDDMKRKTGRLTFVSATDGNHGRGVAWTAKQLGQRAVIYMPKGSAEERLKKIQMEGAEASITDLNYDDAVRLAAAKARENGWILVQDTAWDGYEKVPGWIIQGYATMADEIYEQLEGVRPTHIFVQAGVGSLAGAVIGYFSKKYGKNKPKMVVVEPDEADCIYRSVAENDGRPYKIKGYPHTIMAGLSCGEPNTASLKILLSYADYYLSCPDYVAANGMRILANPLSDDTKIIAGESGAAGFGAAMEVLRNDDYRDLKNVLGIDKNSRLLFINTEGDTDRKNYLKTVWDGIYSLKQ